MGVQTKVALDSSPGSHSRRSHSRARAGQNGCCIMENGGGLRGIGGAGSGVLEGFATLERAHVLLYRQSREAAARAGMRLDVPGPVTPFSTLPSPEEFPVMKLSESGQLLRRSSSHDVEVIRSEVHGYPLQGDIHGRGCGVRRSRESDQFPIARSNP